MCRPTRSTSIHTRRRWRGRQSTRRVEGGGKRLRICGDVHQPGLQSRNDGESRPDQQHVSHGKPGMAGREDQETKHGCVPDEKATDCGQQGAISQA
jgi:hypothetical protein